jgi:hypothetical protein
MTSYTVEEVVGSREWTGRNGTNVDYTLALIGVPEQVRLTQQKDTPAPTEGQELDVTLEDFKTEQIEKYAPLANMKKAVKAGGGGWGGGGGGGGPRQDDPRTNRSIGMQASQKVALQMTMFAIEHNLDEETIARMTALFSRFSKAMYRSVQDAVEDKI